MCDSLDWRIGLVTEGRVGLPLGRRDLAAAVEQISSTATRVVKPSWGQLRVRDTRRPLNNHRLYIVYTRVTALMFNPFSTNWKKIF